MNPRTPLAKIDSVALLTGKTIGAIYAMADGGDLVDGRYQWVWNVSAVNGNIRDLRWWIGEVLVANEEDRKRKERLSLAQVIDFIVPPKRREFPAGEVCQLLQIRPITLSELRGELNGALRANSGFYPRSGLVEFLKNRWLGCESHLPSLASGGQSASSEFRAANRSGQNRADIDAACSGVVRTAHPFKL